MSGAMDTLLRVSGGFVAIVAAILTALVEAVLTPLYLGTFRLPVALVLAVVGNLALVWFAWQATRSKLFSLVPGLVWMGIMIVLSGKTTEGDIILAGNNWVALATLLAGVVAYAVGAYRLLVPPARPRPGPAVPSIDMSPEDPADPPPSGPSASGPSVDPRPVPPATGQVHGRARS